MSKEKDGEENIGSEADKAIDAERQKMKQEAEKELTARAEQAAGRLEAANREMKQLILKQETMKAERSLGGKADAGKEEPGEESPEDYAKRVMEGSV